MRFIDPAGRRVNRSDDSVGVIDHPVVFVSWPSFESVLTNQCGFWIGVALILLVYFRTRTWTEDIRVLIVIGLVRRMRPRVQPNSGQVRDEADTTPWIFGGATLAIALALFGIGAGMASSLACRWL